MSLVKLPFLVAIGLGVKLSYAPPSQPQKTEMITPTSVEMFTTSFIAGILPIFKASISCAVLAEAATIILPRIPPSQLPEFAPGLLKALGGPDMTPITPYFVAGSILASMGGLIRWQCYRALGQFFTFPLSIRKDHRLVTHGPYSIVRHPSYTGALSNVLGLTLFYGSPDSWLRGSGVLSHPFLQACVAVCVSAMAFIVTLAFIRCPVEDRLLHKEFGKDWEDWAKRVKYWIIPGIY